MKLLINDFKKNKLFNSIIFIFITVTTTLILVSFLTVFKTFASVNHLYEKAKTPHFSQMHKGVVNYEEVEEFLNNEKDVVSYEIVETLVTYGNEITIGNIILDDLMLDVGLMKQNENFDYLLNNKYEIVRLNQGEIGIPIILAKMYKIKIGEEVVLNINGNSYYFILKEFVLDSMMNSTMASSTRILLADVDFNNLRNVVNENEYLINVRLTTSNKASAFQTIYENANMPKNGQAVTYTIIYLLSALTGLITAFIIILVSILLLVISFILIKFTITTTLEEELLTIGTLKGIGFTNKNVKNIYLMKYQIISVISIFISLLLVNIFSSFLTKNITTTFGNPPKSVWLFVSLILVSGLVYLLVITILKKTIKPIDKISVIEAILLGKGIDENLKDAKVNFLKTEKINTNSKVALKNLRYYFKRWRTVLFTIVLTTLVIMIPINILNTFNNENFISYMGNVKADILIEIPSGDNLSLNKEKTETLLKNDESVKDYQEIKRVNVQTIDFGNLSIDISNNTRSLKYLSGKAPKGMEIAISYLNSNKLGKGVNDRIILKTNEEELTFVISGVYQDVTSGGFTAKTAYLFNEEAIKYFYNVNLYDAEKSDEVAKNMQEVLGNEVAVNPLDSFIAQTLGGVTSEISGVVYLIVGVGVGLSVLVFSLFLKLKLLKDESDIKTLRGIGFSKKELSFQYLLQALIVTGISLITGLVISLFLGNGIVNLGLSFANIGIVKIKLFPNYIVVVIYPIVLTVLIIVVTKVLLRGKLNALRS